MIIHNGELVASGLPDEPWALYRNATRECIRVEYNGILRRTVARKAPNHVHEAEGRPAQPVKPVVWEVEPTLWVDDVPSAVNDDFVNRSRVLTRKNWMFITSAVLAFVHFAGSCAGLFNNKELMRWRGGWIVICEVFLGLSLGCGYVWIAKRWNNGSLLQVTFAMALPIFWSLSYAGAEGPRTGLFWRIPIWGRLLMSALCLVTNIEHSATKVVGNDLGFFEIALPLLGVCLLLHCTLSARITQEWCGAPGAYSPGAEFVLAGACAHEYVIATNLILQWQAHEDDWWIFGIALLILLEMLVLFIFGERIREVLSLNAVSISRRYNDAAGLLAGTPMAVNLTQGLDEKDNMAGHFRRVVPLTWVVRGEKASMKLGACGTWQSANRLLPFPETCRLVSRPVVGNSGSGVTIHVLSLHRDLDEFPHVAAQHEEFGNATIALGPAPTQYFRNTVAGEEESSPLDFVEKDGVGFLRALGGGIIGFPIVG